MKSTDLSVYDFKDEDELAETCYTWSSKLTNPKFDDDVDVPLTKYQFLQHASSGSITQMKEIRPLEQIHVVAIDDDDSGFVNNISSGPQDSDKLVSKQSEVFGAISDRIVQQRCHLSGDDVKPKSSSLDMEIRITCPRVLSPENGYISPPNPESPCSNDSGEAGVSDGCDSIQASSPSTSGSEQEEYYASVDRQAQDQSVSGWNLEEMNIVYTDYVFYGGKYFPTCPISFFENSFKIEIPVLEEESGVSMSEWNVDDIHSIESQWCSKANTAKVKVRLITRDGIQADNAHGIEVLEFLVHDPNWLDKEAWITSLDVRYQAAWSVGLNDKISEGGAFSLENDESSPDPYIPIFQEPFEEVVYPKGEADAVSISKRDVDLLEPDIFLNDTIIDFYMKYLKSAIPSSDRRRFHFFNSFFFRKLADPDKNPSGVFDGKAGFQRVRKWTRKVNIFEKDYVFLPVNYNLHWSLIVICHPGEVANSNDETIDESVKVPCILHMDSIRGSHSGLKDLVQSYLLEEWKEKQKETSEEIGSKFLNLRFLSLELPQQENFSDCGLFLLHYAELFIAEAPENFSPFQINKFENFLKPDWFMPAEASLKRVYIQRLIYELLEGSPPENASPCNNESQPSAFPEDKENDNDIEMVSNRRSPVKSWNPLRSQPVQGMEMGLMDMSLYRTPECTNVPGLGMRDLLEQCHHFDQGASFVQPGCPIQPIKEENGAVDLLTPSSISQSEVKPIDGAGAAAAAVAEACVVGYRPAEFDQGFQWNSGLPNQGGPEDNILPSKCSSDDSAEMIIVECEREVQSASSDQNKNSDQAKENIDNMTESYASASSDMMETPAEDSQELAKIYGSNDQEDPYFCNQEEADEPSHQEHEIFNDDGNTTGMDEVVEDSSSDTDEKPAAKRLRLSPSSDGERELATSLSKEVQV